MKTTIISDPEKVGAAVAARRVRLDLGQLELAAAGVSKSTLSLIENGRRDRYSNRILSSLRLALEWPPDWLPRIEADEDLTEYEPPGHIVTRPEPREALAAMAGSAEEYMEFVNRIVDSAPDLTAEQAAWLVPRMRAFAKVVASQAQAAMLLVEADRLTVNQLDAEPTLDQLDVVVRRLARDVERLKGADFERGATPTALPTDRDEPQSQ